MATETITSAQDLLERTRAILNQTGRAPSASASACCSSEKQDVCCEASEKASCCGAESSAGAGCGCQ